METRTTADRHRGHCLPAGPDAGQAFDDLPPARMVAGALAHLARHMETGCPRSSALAAMLLSRLAVDPDAGTQLRQHAMRLAEALDREPRDLREGYPA